MRHEVFIISTFFVTTIASAQKSDPYKPDLNVPPPIPGMVLKWNDEFNTSGQPDSSKWTYERGFVRNEELQWYQPQNATCKNGCLLIAGKRERIRNPNYNSSSQRWQQNREFAEYTAASLKTQGRWQFQYGRLEVRARVDTSMGSWPAIWTLGVSERWPLNGEVDIMEFYRVGNSPTILANAAWGRSNSGGPVWNTKRIPLANFLSKDRDWPKKFHVWRMDWTADSIKLYLDDELLNAQALRQTLNPDGKNPFQQPHYLLLNLAIGANGGDPANTRFPISYEVDYVRFYQPVSSHAPHSN